MVRSNHVIWGSATVAGVLGGILLALLAFQGSAGAADASVSISGLAYNPASVTINVGDSVTWTNNDAGVPHTVTSDSGTELNSPNLNAGQTYVNQFDAAGTYTYHCTIHPTMAGTVIVQQAAASPTASPTNTATPTATTTAATSTPTATGTASPTSTQTATATSTPTTIPPTATNTPSATQAAASPTPGAPNTGETAAQPASNAGVMALALGVVAVIGASGAALALRGSSRR